MRQVHAVWAGGDPAAATRLVTDAMIEKFSLTGSRARCRQRLRELLDAGVYPIVYPIPRRDRVVEDHLAAIRLVAEYAA